MRALVLLAWNVWSYASVALFAGTLTALVAAVAWGGARKRPVAAFAGAAGVAALGWLGLPSFGVILLPLGVALAALALRLPDARGRRAPGFALTAGGVAAVAAVGLVVGGNVALNLADPCHEVRWSLAQDGSGTVSSEDFPPGCAGLTVSHANLHETVALGLVAPALGLAGFAAARAGVTAGPVAAGVLLVGLGAAGFVTGTVNAWLVAPPLLWAGGLMVAGGLRARRETPPVPQKTLK